MFLSWSAVFFLSQDTSDQRKYSRTHRFKELVQHNLTQICLKILYVSNPPASIDSPKNENDHIK